MAGTLDIQRAIYEALIGDPAVIAATGQIFSRTVQEVAPEAHIDLPLVTFGTVQGTNFNTQTTRGLEETVQIDVWANGQSYAPLKTAMDAIIDLMDTGTLSIAGGDHVLTRLETYNVMPDPDGVTLHGVMQFGVIMTK